MLDAFGDSAPRVMATSQRDLMERMEAGQFRQDLFYRLGGVTLTVPSLRERVDDIPLLVTHFLSRAERDGLPLRRFSNEAMDLIRAYSWPGNVRQLENTIKRLTVTGQSEEIGKAEVEMVLGNQPAIEPLMGGAPGDKLSSSVAKHLRRYFDLHGGAAACGALQPHLARSGNTPDRNRAGGDGRQSGQMCGPAGHQPQYLEKKDHRSGYPRDSSPQVDVNPQQSRGRWATARSRPRHLGGAARGSTRGQAGRWPDRPLWRFKEDPGVRSVATLGLVLLGPVLAVLTFLVLGPLSDLAEAPGLRLILLADLVYVLLVAGLVAREVARIVASRRAQSAGSRLHLRLTGVFTVVALVPTILVAVFATITVNMGLEGWFSDRVSRALGNSVDAAVAYSQEHRDDLSTDTLALANFLNLNRRATVLLSDGDLRQLLTQGQSRIQRGLEEAFVIDGAGEIRARGESSYLFDYDLPSESGLAQAADGDLVLIEDRTQNEFRALMRLDAFPDRYLYVSREVDGAILALLDETQQTVQLYRQLEADRGRVLFEFGLLYLGFALIMVMAAIWLGLWFAERLSRPVGQLAGAAQRVGQGDLSVRVPEERGDDEIAMLGRLFNQMTRQLKGQRDTLIEQNCRDRKRAGGCSTACLARSLRG